MSVVASLSKVRVKSRGTTLTDASWSLPTRSAGLFVDIDSWNSLLDNITSYHSLLHDEAVNNLFIET